MTGTEIALDTNLAIAILNDKSGAGEWVGQYTTICLPVPALGELRFGALQSAKSNENLARVERLASRCRILDITVDTTLAYARIRVELKRAGTPIPENDVWIAALCMQHGIALATDDAHFDHVGDLRVVRRSAAT